MICSYVRHKRRYAPDDPFFDDGNATYLCGQKQLALPSYYDTLVQQSDAQEEEPAFLCNIAGCKASFVSVSAFEDHYNSAHKHTCDVCGARMPSARFLDRHVLETHDSMFKVLAETKKMVSGYQLAYRFLVA